MSDPWLIAADVGSSGLMLIFLVGIYHRLGILIGRSNGKLPDPSPLPPPPTR